MDGFVWFYARKRASLGGFKVVYARKRASHGGYPSLVCLLYPPGDTLTPVIPRL